VVVDDRNKRDFCQPLIFCICASNIRHPASPIGDECRNDSADASAPAENPNDLTRSLVAAQAKCGRRP
jgi:hypothetical protein